MKYKFWKYQGTGNDFIFLDGRDDVNGIKDNKEVIAQLCDRRFGIGADGLIILEPSTVSDFRMVYYNSDGGESTMCGNGGRCSIAFANFIGMAGAKTNFQAIDGDHLGEVSSSGIIELGMIDVSEINKIDKRTYELNTGSPHYVRILEAGEKVDIVEYGKSIRYGEDYAARGINVNTISITESGISVETYERGVEGETFSCGTGVTACALAYYDFLGGPRNTRVPVSTKGGDLSVTFTKTEAGFTNIVLSGPATLVYKGEIEL